MAMDNFKEEIVVKRHSGAVNVAYYLAWVLLVISGIIGLLMLNFAISSIGNPVYGFQWQQLVIGVLFAGIAVLIWLKKDGLRVEYEYTFTNGVLDVSMVMNNSKRRYLMELPLKIVESCGSVNHPSFKRYLSDKTIKKHNWFLNRGAELYYFYFQKEANKRIIIIEPSEERVDYIKHYLPRGAWQE